MTTEYSASSNLFWALGGPTDFDGSVSANPLDWLKHMQRLKKGLWWSDEDALIVVGVHLTDIACTWWDSVAPAVTTWKEFEDAFKKEFISDRMKSHWWDQIRNMEQEEGQMVDDLANQLRKLFELVSVTDEQTKVMYFVNAMHGDLAYAMETRGIPKTWNAAIALAQSIEALDQKYIRTAAAIRRIKGKRIGTVPTSSDTDSIGSTLLELVQEMRALKIHLVDRPKGSESGQPTGGCWHCGEVGHRRNKCPQLAKERKGADSEKGNGRQ